MACVSLNELKLMFAETVRLGGAIDRMLSEPAVAGGGVLKIPPLIAALCGGLVPIPLTSKR